MTWARRIIFYLFLLTYLIICPLLILYSFGFIFSPLDKQITRTGILYLASLPSGANIYLGNSRYEYKTPASINELLPGRYDITLRLKGYKSWTRSISIEAGKASVFGNILLAPVVLEKKKLLTDFHADLIPMPGEDFFFLSSGDTLGEYQIFDWRRVKARQLLSSKSPFYELSVISIFNQPESRQVLMYAGSLWDREYLLFRPGRKVNAIQLTQLFPEQAKVIKWSPRNDSVIFTFQGDYLNRLDIPSMTVSPKYIEGVKGFGLSGHWIYLVDKDNTVSRCTFDKENRSALFTDNIQLTRLLEAGRFYDIRVIDEDTVLFLSEKGQLAVNVAPYNLADSGVRGIEYNREQRKLLYWTKDAIFIVDFTSYPEENNPLRNRYLQPQIIYGQGRDIEQCFWAYNATHLVFLDKGQIYLLELSSDGQYRMEETSRAQVRSNSSVFYCEENGYLYYLDYYNGNLESVKIVPKESAVFSPFHKESNLREQGV